MAGRARKQRLRYAVLASTQACRWHRAVAANTSFAMPGLVENGYQDTVPARRIQRPDDTYAFNIGSGYGTVPEVPDN